MRLIDADALIRRFKTTSPMAIDGRARKVVEEMPTIEPERKTGRWMRIPYDGIYCTACGKGWSFMLGAPGDVENYHYCPNCGSAMEGAEQE